MWLAGKVSKVTSHKGHRGLIAFVAGRKDHKGHKGYNGLIVFVSGSSPANSGLFSHLRKALYGLKQAPRAWHSTLAAALEQFGFMEGEADPGLWFRGEGEHRWVVVYVDDCW